MPVTLPPAPDRPPLPSGSDGLTVLMARWPGARTTCFGDSPALSDRLLGLIRSGRKTATCGALAHYRQEGEPVPQTGDVLIALDHRDQPALAYRLTDVSICAFRDVPKDFALAEGGGGFADWRQGHIDYFQRNGGFSDDMALVCERFRLIWVAGPHGYLDNEEDSIRAARPEPINRGEPCFQKS